MVSDYCNEVRYIIVPKLYWSNSAVDYVTLNIAEKLTEQFFLRTKQFVLSFEYQTVDIASGYKNLYVLKTLMITSLITRDSFVFPKSKLEKMQNFSIE